VRNSNKAIGGTSAELQMSQTTVNKSYCCTVHFCRITSIINQKLHLHNFHIKHLKSLRHVSILSDHHQGSLLFLAKVILQYSKFDSFLQTRCCGSMSCCVGMCCRESSWLGVHRMLRNEGLIISHKFYVCVTVHHRYNNINSQLDATIKIILLLLLHLLGCLCYIISYNSFRFTLPDVFTRLMKGKRF